MVRIDELVDHGHFDEFVSGGNQRIGIVDKCSRITGNGNDFSGLSPTGKAASRAVCAAAPARGGSKTTALKPLSSVASSGYLNRFLAAISMLGIMFLLTVRRKPSSRRSDESTARTRLAGLRASGYEKVPTPQNKSAMRPEVSPRYFSTRVTSACSPSRDGCRKVRPEYKRKYRQS